MRAIVAIPHGEPDVLKYHDVADPVPGPTDLLVRTASVGVNFIDTYLRRGLYLSQPPYIPGAEGAGVVTAIGAEVSHFTVGDRVAWCDVAGSYAESVVVPQSEPLWSRLPCPTRWQALCCCRGSPPTTCSTGVRTRSPVTPS